MRAQLSAVPKPPHEAGAQGRKVLAVLAVCYLAFVVYGSLVPLNWSPRPLADAWTAFAAIPYRTIRAGDRADWVANVLLMIPLAFLLAGALSGRPRGWLGAVLSLGICAALAVVIEFVQLFFPPRTVSLNDILAEMLGGALGVALWLWRGPALCTAVSRWSRETHVEARSTVLLYGYLTSLAIYNLLPFDLTLSLTELYGKLHSRRLVLVPFSFPYDDLGERILDMFLDVVAWVPVGILARLSRAGSTRQVLLFCVVLAASLELMQLFVLSRVSDPTDVIMAALGAAAGIGLARVFGASPRPASPAGQRPSPMAGYGAWALALAYAVLILAALWFPYDFDPDAAAVRARYKALWSVPLERLYFQSEFRAISTVVLKAGLFVPLGVLLALAIARVPLHRRGIAMFFAAVFVALLALVGEVGQVLLPRHYPDLTDVAIELAGAVLAAVLVLGPLPIVHAFARRRGTWTLLVVYVLLLALVWTATHLPGAPYNVRELLRPGLPALSAALLSAAILWIGLFPTLARETIRGRDGGSALVRWPLLLLGHAIVAYLLLALAVPEESIGDLVGSPVLGVSRELEYLVRSVVLYATVVWLLFVGGLTAWQKGPYAGTPGQLRAIAVIVSVFFLPVAHWVIVVQAATDNLVELMRDGGGAWQSVVLASLTVVVGATGAWIARILRRRAALALLRACLLIAASAGIAHLLVQLGTEPALYKYGKVFSASQFLLSTDRDHYLSGGALLLRFLAVYLFAVLLVVLSNWPVVPPVREASHPEGSQAAPRNLGVESHRRSEGSPNGQARSADA